MTAYRLIAATGCPTGISHTYMAQAALEQAAEDRNVSIKVETHGQIGVENELTSEEIAAAEAVIIAADKDVHAERFAGKRVISVSVGRGIKEADQLIEQALTGEGQIMTGSDATSDQPVTVSDNKYEESIGRQLYRHIMNGVSHMLPLVVGGGVLTAISFLWGIYSANPDNAQYNAFAAMLNQIGGVAMGLMVPVFSGYIAESIAKRPGLIVGFVGGMIAAQTGSGFLGGILSGFLSGYIILALGRLLKWLPKAFDGLKAIFLFPVLGIFIIGAIMYATTGPVGAINNAMTNFLVNAQESSPFVLGIIVGCMSAFDMGGPVNKAAYVTGTALLGQGNYTFMAGVSAACIAPPLMTTIAVLLFGKYYTKEERNAGYVNSILGSTHITEGAIPFAAVNPLWNIPAMMIGASVASILTYIWKVEVPAPHGGFLVLPVVTHGLHWVIAILIGSFIGGILLGLIKKRDSQHETKRTETTKVGILHG
ncbi:MAG: fructose-specific PTS transporter subunit EIIC [Aerococcus sp.]|nr:fructose-specific PTS transporter subunit EIIC [Aerococcus sp.]